MGRLSCMCDAIKLIILWWNTFARAQLDSIWKIFGTWLPLLFKIKYTGRTLNVICRECVLCLYLSHVGQVRTGSSENDKCLRLSHVIYKNVHRGASTSEKPLVRLYHEITRRLLHRLPSTLPLPVIRSHRTVWSCLPLVAGISGCQRKQRWPLSS